MRERKEDGGDLRASSLNHLTVKYIYVHIHTKRMKNIKNTNVVK